MNHACRSHAIMLALPPAEAFVAGFGEAAFRAMVEGWKGLIEAWLRARD